MPQILFNRKNTNEIDTTPIEDGQLLYDIETGQTYMDINKKRIKVGNVDYKILNNKPSINGVILSENTTLEDLGIVIKDYDETINKIKDEQLVQNKDITKNADKTRVLERNILDSGFAEDAEPLFIKDGAIAEAQQLILKDSREPQKHYEGYNLLKKQGLSTPKEDKEFWDNISSALIITPKENNFSEIAFKNNLVQCFIKGTQLNIKPSTHYTIILEIKNIKFSGDFEIELTNQYVENGINESIFDGLVRLPLKSNGIFKFKTNSVANLDGKVFRILWRASSSNTEDDSFKADVKVSVVEEKDENKPSEPYVGGIPAPNPLFPQPIEKISEDFPVKFTGKNLFDDDYTKYTQPLDYWILPIALEKGKKYVMSASLKGTLMDNIVVGVASNGSNYADFKTLRRIIGLGGNISPSIPFEIDEKWTSPKLVVYATKGRNELKQIFENYDIQFEENDKPTSYEPYKETSNTVELKGNELLSVSDTVRDRYIFKFSEEDGRYWKYIEKNCGKKILNGMETFLGGGVSNVDFWFSQILVGDMKKSSVLLCNNLLNKRIYDVATEGVASGGKNGDVLNLKVLLSRIETPDESGFRKWLKTKHDSGNPLEVIYQLKEPQLIPIAPIDDMFMIYDDCTRVISSLSYCNFTVNYYRNFITTIRNLQIDNKGLQAQLQDIETRLKALEVKKVAEPIVEPTLEEVIPNEDIQVQ